MRRREDRPVVPSTQLGRPGREFWRSRCSAATSRRGCQTELGVHARAGPDAAEASSGVSPRRRRWPASQRTTAGPSDWAGGQTPGCAIAGLVRGSLPHHGWPTYRRPSSRPWRAARGERSRSRSSARFGTSLPPAVPRVPPSATSAQAVLIGLSRTATGWLAMITSRSWPGPAVAPGDHAPTGSAQAAADRYERAGFPPSVPVRRRQPGDAASCGQRAGRGRAEERARSRTSERTRAGCGAGRSWCTGASRRGGLARTSTASALDWRRVRLWGWPRTNRLQPPGTSGRLHLTTERQDAIDALPRNRASPVRAASSSTVSGACPASLISQ